MGCYIYILDVPLLKYVCEVSVTVPFLSGDVANSTGIYII